MARSSPLQLTQEHWNKVTKAVHVNELWVQFTNRTTRVTGQSSPSCWTDYVLNICSHLPSLSFTVGNRTSSSEYRLSSDLSWSEESRKVSLLLAISSMKICSRLKIQKREQQQRCALFRTVHPVKCIPVSSTTHLLQRLKKKFGTQLCQLSLLRTDFDVISLVFSMMLVSWSQTESLAHVALRDYPG